MPGPVKMVISNSVTQHFFDIFAGSYESFSSTARGAKSKHTKNFSPGLGQIKSIFINTTGLFI